MKGEQGCVAQVFITQTISITVSFSLLFVCLLHKRYAGEYLHGINPCMTLQTQSREQEKAKNAQWKRMKQNQFN